MTRAVSVAFSSYNQVAFVREALESVLAQDHEDLQIVVFDDGSTDGTQDVIRDVLSGYDGPHEVVSELRSTNDIWTAFSGVLERCDGDYIVVAHGDDVSHHTRVTRLVTEATRLGVSLVTSNAVFIDEQGEAMGYWRDPDEEYDCSLHTLARVGHVAAELGAGISFERRVWDEFGPMRKGPRNVDGILTVRAGLLAGAHLDPEPTLLYRRREGQTALWAMINTAPSDEQRRVLEERHLQNNVANAVVYVELVQEHLQRHPDDEHAREALGLFVGHLHRAARRHSHYRDDLVRAGLAPM